MKLGTGFAFYGNQYHLEVSGKDYYFGPKIHEQLEQIQHKPNLVRSFFQHPDVSYIFDC